MRVDVMAKYRGATLFGEMDSLAVADAIRASVELVNVAANITYGADAVSHGRVTAFRESSFEIHQVFEVAREGVALAAAALPILPPIEDVKPLIELLKAGFQLLKHLRGESAKKIIYADNGAVAVENNNGTINYYDNKTINLVMSSQSGRSVRRLIGNPLSTEADEVEVKVGGQVVVAAKRSEADFFRDVAPANENGVSRQKIILRVISPVLEGSAQWKFHDGGRTITAKIEDRSFMKRVDEGREKFRRGDRILALLRTEQSRGPRNGLRIRFVVEEVLEREDGFASELPL